MRIKAFLFDLDGVLTDTSEFHFLGWKRLADEEGIPFTREDNEQLRGVDRRESLRRMLKGRLVPEAQMLEWMERKNNYYVDMLRQMTPANMLPGARELLEEIRSAGLKSAVVSSSKNAPLAIDRLQIGPLVDVLVDGREPVPTKPAPDLFLAAARKLGLSPEVCVVVEDAEAGVQAGLAGGMRTVGLGPVERVGIATLVLPSLEGVKLVDLLSRLA